MGYYADLIKQKKEKRNSKYSYKLVDKGYSGVLKDEEHHKWVVQTWYGSKLVDEQEVTGPKSKAESQGQKNVAAFERRYPENEKEEKGYYASIIEKKNSTKTISVWGKTFRYDDNDLRDIRRCAREIDEYEKQAKKDLIDFIKNFGVGQKYDAYESKFNREFYLAKDAIYKEIAHFG